VSNICARTMNNLLEDRILKDKNEINFAVKVLAVMNNDTAKNKIPDYILDCIHQSSYHGRRHTLAEAFCIGEIWAGIQSGKIGITYYDIKKEPMADKFRKENELAIIEEMKKNYPKCFDGVEVTGGYDEDGIICIRNMNIKSRKYFEIHTVLNKRKDEITKDIIDKLKAIKELDKNIKYGDYVLNICDDGSLAISNKLDSDSKELVNEYEILGIKHHKIQETLHVPLEIGDTNATTTWQYLFGLQHNCVVRWPYNSGKMFLFYNLYPRQDIWER
jgi:hypothetical protein